MKKPNSKPKAHHLVVRRIDSTLPFPALAAVLEACLEGRSDGELFVDPSDGLVRVGGLRLRGDVLIRPECAGEEHRLLVAHRHVDQKRVEPVFSAMAAVWRDSDRQPSSREGLALLEFLQGDSVIGHLRMVEISSRAVEDAFGCRFSALRDLRMKLVELNGRAMGQVDHDLLLDDDTGLAYDPAALAAPKVVMHAGKRQVLDSREYVSAPRDAVLTLHVRRVRCHGAYLIGAITERRRT